MRKVFIPVFVLLFINPFAAIAQEVCHDMNATAEATEQFAALGKEKEFQMAHEKPKSLNEYVQKGKMIEIEVVGGEKSSAYLVQSNSETDKYLFLIHEWWGLNDNIKREAEEWATQLGNVHVLALDLYDGKSTANPQEAGKLMQSVKTERAKAIIEAAFNYAGKKADIATMGWCFGGGWSIQSALIGKNQVVGTVAYYGMPEMDVEKLKTLHADIMAVYGTKDKWITPEVGAKFENAMKEAGKKVESFYYDADHAFANPSNPNWDEKSAKDAQEKAETYLKARFN